MKRFIIIAMMLFMATNVFAQEIVEVVNVNWNTKSKAYQQAYTGSQVTLSNGDILEYCAYETGALLPKANPGYRGWILLDKDGYHGKKVNFSTRIGYNIRGAKYQKYGNTYTPFHPERVGIYTIKKVSIHDVNSEFTASMNADFSYRGFFYRRASGSASGSAKGGTRTIVNIFFENGKKATIEASSDPIWLDAEPGMQVEHYQVGNQNYYNLL